NRIFNVGDQVLLFNSRLKIFSGKLKSHWSGPFTISEIYPYSTAKLIHPDGFNFNVNCHRLKHYHGGNPPPLEIPDCQPITFQINFSGSDQIQTPQYPEIHLSSQETSDEVFQANHAIQNEESFDPSNEIAVSNPNQEKEEPPQDFDIHQLIEESSTEVNDLIESAFNPKLLLINSNSQRLDKKDMGYEHLSITPETKSDEVTESNAENLLPIPSKCEVTSGDEIDDDELLPGEDVLAKYFKFYLNPLFDEDEINYDKLDPHCFNVESNFVESLLNRNTFIDFSSKFDFYGELAHDGNSQQEEIDVVTETDDVLPSSDENDDDLSNYSLLEEVDLFLSDNSIPPGIENFADNPEGDIHFLEELLIDDSILSHKSFDFNFEDNLSIPRPPPEPPDVETDVGEEISVMMNVKDKFD
nr:reverse transcriptase domain-containing protein [Tanacetum cinerariifolium]